MKRRNLFISLLFLLIFSNICFADTPSSYFRLTGRATVVDLAAKYYFTHLSSAVNTDTNVSNYAENSATYHRNQIVIAAGVMNCRETDRNINNHLANGWTYDSTNGVFKYNDEVTDDPPVFVDGWSYSAAENLCVKANGAIKISVKPHDGINNWFYTLSEDNEFKRPYGLDVFARGRYLGEDKDLYEISGIGGVHLGLQKTNASNPDYMLIPESEVAKYDYIWFDVCLVLDPIVDQGSDSVTLQNETYHVISSDAYYLTMLDINIICGASSNGDIETPIINDPYLTQLTGYYKPADANSMKTNTAMLFVEKLPDANGFNINSAYLTGDWYEIATYDFTTDSKSYKTSSKPDPGHVYMFLSSTREASTTQSGRFTLVNEGMSGQQQGEFNTQINYVLKIVPEDGGFGSVGNGENSYFTGMDSLNDRPDANSTSSPWLDITAEKSFYLNGEYYYARWHNKGKIKLAILPNQQDTPTYTFTVDDGRLNLASGTYTSNIYIHIVTDFN